MVDHLFLLTSVSVLKDVVNCIIRIVYSDVTCLGPLQCMYTPL